MVLFGYGDYDYACRQIPSLPTCNLFLKHLVASGVVSPNLNEAGVGVNSTCAIPRMNAAGGDPDSYGNIANIIVAGISFFVALHFAVLASRRHAAVARAEMVIFLIIYALTNVFQILTTGSFLKQASGSLSWLTAVHLGLIVVLFFVLLWLGVLLTQKVEDGQLSSFIPLTIGAIILFVGPTYIFLDTAFSVSGYFDTSLSNNLHNAWIFSLTIVWPAAAAFIYFVIAILVVVLVLRETKPLFFFLGSAFLFILSQAAYYALSHRICTGTSARIDGSFVATILETLAVVVLYFGWKSVTETSWDDYNSTSAFAI